MINKSYRKKKRDYLDSDNRETPLWLAKKIVDYFQPSGKILEPCAGKSKNFLKVLPKGTLYCEIQDNKDFFDFKDTVDWIITNPPWKLFSEFLEHSLEISNHIVFVCAFHYIGTRKRLKMIADYHFWFKDILLVDTPKEWGGWGFQLICFHIEKNYNGMTKIQYI